MSAARSIILCLEKVKLIKAYEWAVLRIPAKANAFSEGKPNGIPG